MNILLRALAKDSTIEVKSSAANEEFKQSQYSKTMITDIPSWLTDARIADLEMQKAAQDFIFTRTELYGSDMLLLQYSVEEKQAKAELQYNSIKEAIIAVLMVESPKALKDFESERYIHRVTDRVADSGFRYPSKVKLIFVQLDKCLEQFKRGVDGEKDGKLQLWLATIADPNDEQVKVAAEKDEVLRSGFCTDVPDQYIKKSK